MALERRHIETRRRRRRAGGGRIRGASHARATRARAAREGEARVRADAASPSGGGRGRGRGGVRGGELAARPARVGVQTPPAAARVRQRAGPRGTSSRETRRSWTRRVENRKQTARHRHRRRRGVSIARGTQGTRQRRTPMVGRGEPATAPRARSRAAVRASGTPVTED